MSAETKAISIEQALKRFRCMRDLQMSRETDDPAKAFVVPGEVMTVFQREHDLIRHLFQFPCELAGAGVYGEYMEVRDYKHAFKVVRKLVDGGHCTLGQPVDASMLLNALVTEYAGNDAYYVGIDGDAWLEEMQIGAPPNLVTALRMIVPQWVARYQLRQKKFYAEQLISRINKESDPFPVNRDWEVELKRGLNENDGIDVGKTLSQMMLEHDARDQTMRNLIPLGFKDIDNANGGGAGRGDMVVVGGGTSNGKSYFAERMLRNQAQMQRHVLHVAVEDPPEIMVARAIADFSLKINSSGAAPAAIRRRSAPVDLVEESIRIGVEEIGDFIHYVDAPKVKLSDLCRIMRKARNLYHVDMVIVDYLQAVQPDEPSNMKTNDVALIVAELKKCAREIGVVLVLFSQYGRDEYRDNQEPGINACKWAGEIENEAEIMILLWRDGDGMLHCKVAKLKWSQSDQLRFTIAVDPNTGVLLDWSPDFKSPETKQRERRNDRGNGSNKPN